MGGISSTTTRRVPRRLLVLGLAMLPTVGCAELGISPGTAPYTTSVGVPVGPSSPTTQPGTPPTTAPGTPPTTTPPGPTSGTISLFAGNGSSNTQGDGGPAVNAGMFWARDMAVGPDGSVYVSHFFSHQVRRILPNGVIVNFAGTGVGGSHGDGGPAIDAQLQNPVGLAVDGAGNVYISDHWNYTVRRVDTNGTITRIAGQPGQKGYGGDGGPAINSVLNETEGLALDNQGRLLLADFFNHRIRRINHDGTIVTIAGNGNKANTDGTATSASLDTPAHIAVASDGTIYVSSADAHIIRRIDTNGYLSTFAGSGSHASVDGNGTGASFHGPNGLAVDGAGNLYVADSQGARVRRITPAGVVTTVALKGNTAYSGDGGPALQAGGGVIEVDIDQSGALLIADNSNHRIRRIS